MTFILVTVVAAALAAAPAAAQKGKADPAKGKAVFEQCAVCHAVDTADHKLMGPGLKGLFKRAKLKNGKKVTDENVRSVINSGGNGMPPYSEMLSAADKDALIAYLKTL